MHKELSKPAPGFVVQAVQPLVSISPRCHRTIGNTDYCRQRPKSTANTIGQRLAVNFDRQRNGPPFPGIALGAAERAGKMLPSRQGGKGLWIWLVGIEGLLFFPSGSVLLVGYRLCCSWFGPSSLGLTVYLAHIIRKWCRRYPLAKNIRLTTTSCGVLPNACPNCETCHGLKQDQRLNYAFGIAQLRPFCRDWCPCDDILDQRLISE